MVNFNELFVSEPCLYIKIMSHERRGKEGQGAPQGFTPRPKWNPISWAGTQDRTEARQLDFYMLKSAPFVHQVRETGSNSVQAGEGAGPLCRSISDSNNACKMRYSQTTPDPRGSEVSPWARKCQNSVSNWTA